MPNYTYNALDRDGQPVTGEIDSPGRAEAIARLAEQDIYVTEIVAGQLGAAPRGRSMFSLLRRRRVRPRARAAMLRQLATALQAGLPLLSGLMHEPPRRFAPPPEVTPQEPTEPAPTEGPAAPAARPPATTQGPDEADRAPPRRF